MSTDHPEKQHNPELASPTGREQIERLATTGEYVFHGSPVGQIETFEPRQAHDLGTPDEEPAVFATELPDIAIFMALVNHQNSINPDQPYQSGTSVERDDEGAYFVKDLRATQNLLDGARLPSARGYVYVFPIQHFARREKKQGEFRCLEGIKPLYAISVSSRDLPRSIRVIEP